MANCWGHLCGAIRSYISTALSSTRLCFSKLRCSFVISFPIKNILNDGNIRSWSFPGSEKKKTRQGRICCRWFFNDLKSVELNWIHIRGKQSWLIIWQQKQSIKEENNCCESSWTPPGGLKRKSVSASVCGGFVRVCAYAWVCICFGKRLECVCVCMGVGVGVDVHVRMKEQERKRERKHHYESNERTIKMKKGVNKWVNCCCSCCCCCYRTRIETTIKRGERKKERNNQQCS